MKISIGSGKETKDLKSVHCANKEVLKKGVVD